MDRSLKNLQARFDRQAINQLRQEVTRLSEKLEISKADNAQLEHALEQAQQDARFWQDYAIDLMNGDYGEPPKVGITKMGQLVAIPK